MAIDNGFVFLGKERQLPMPEWWIEDFLTKGSVTMFSAQPKAGKSCFAAQLSYSVATGQPFFDRAVPEGTVLYLTGERAAQTEDRLLELFGDTTPTNIVLWSPTMSNLGSMKLNNRDDCTKLVGELKQRGIRPNFIVVDTLSNFFQGEQNNEQDMGDFFDGVRWISDQFEAAALVLHHDNKEYVNARNQRTGGNSYRGSGAALARVDAYIKARLWRELPDPDDIRGGRTIKIVDIELAEDNWGGSFQVRVAVGKLFADPATFLSSQAKNEGLDSLVIEVIQQAREINVTALEKCINQMNDKRMDGRKFNRNLLGAVRKRQPTIQERQDPMDARSKLLFISDLQEEAA